MAKVLIIGSALSGLSSIAAAEQKHLIESSGHTTIVVDSSEKDLRTEHGDIANPSGSVIDFISPRMEEVGLRKKLLGVSINSHSLNKAAMYNTPCPKRKPSSMPYKPDFKKITKKNRGRK